MFCAPRRRFDSMIALETSLNAVNGGQTTISTSFTAASSRLSPVTRSSASATVLFIFQCPATISFRSLSMFRNSLFVRQRGHARQHLAFQEFQARTAPRAHESDLVAQPGAVQRLHAVAPADDALGAVLLRRLHHR